jgi:hypothetical protein
MRVSVLRPQAVTLAPPSGRSSLFRRCCGNAPTGSDRSSARECREPRVSLFRFFCDSPCVAAPHSRLQLGALIVTLVSGSFSAFAAEIPGSDDYLFRGQSQTHLLLFQNALAPGPGGALVRTETHVPLVQYLSLNASRLDSPLGVDTGEVELSLWAGVEAADPGNGERFQGDLQTATITIHSAAESRRAWLKLGRQVEAGGAARFARFDGLSAGVAIVPGLTLSVYGGFTVLPRWDAEPSYYHLGSAASSLLRDPAAFESRGRDAYGLVGGKLSLDNRRVHAALSVHEQRDRGEIGRRNLGFDVGVPLAERVYLGGSALVDLDSLQLSTARAFADVSLWKIWALGAEYIKAEPALLMSRQSVLSVFGTSGYHEAGGTMGVRPAHWLHLTGSGYAQFYEEGLPGARLSLGARFASSKGPNATILNVGYARVDAVELGYHAARFATSHPLPHNLTATLQAFAYFYDKAIEGYRSSLTGSLAVSYAFAERWELLWAAMASRSPYAAIDASTQLRLTLHLAPTRERGRK